MAEDEVLSFENVSQEQSEYPVNVIEWFPTYLLGC